MEQENKLVVDVSASPQVSLIRRLSMLAEEKAKLGDVMARMLFGTHADDELRGAVRRCRNLGSILQVDCGGAQFVCTDPRLTQWPDCVDFIVRDPNRLADALELNGNARSNFLEEEKRDPLYGSMVIHGLGPLLWTRSPHKIDSEATNRLLNLQGRMVLARLSILDYEYELARSLGELAPDREVFLSLYPPCNFARMFANTSGGWPTAHASLPNVADPKHYIAEINKLKAKYEDAIEANSITLSESERTEQIKIVDALTSVAGFLGRGLKPKDYLKKKYDRMESDSEDSDDDEIPRSTTLSVPVPGDHAVQQETLELIERWCGTKQQKQQLIEAGENPAEALSVLDLIMAGNETMARSAARIVESVNQTLPSDYNITTPVEYARLIRAIRDHREIFGSDLGALEMEAWCDVLLWRGRSAEQAVSLTAVGSTTPLPTEDVVLRFFQIPNQDFNVVAVWRIKALTPEYETQEIRIPGRGRSRQDHFEVVDAGPAGQVIHKALIHRFGSREKAQAALEANPVKVFSRESKWYRDHLKKLQAKVSGLDRITPEMMSATMFHRISECTEDVVTAAIATHTETHLASVRLSYTAVEIEHVRRAERAAVEDIAEELYCARWDGTIANLDSLPHDHNWIGCRGCPTVDEVWRAVTALIGIIRSRPVWSNREGKTGFALRHNAITLYCSWLVSLCVGMRGIVNPFLHEFEYDEVTGYGSINDKYIQRGRNTRPFRLLQLCRDQLKEFRRYHDALVRLGLPPVTRSEPCYFLELTDGEFHAVTVRPATIKARFQAFFPHKPNFFRALCRTELLDAGSVAPAYLDAWCGHACKGEEPLNPFSSFDPQDYFDTIGKALEDLATRLGFEFQQIEPSPLGDE